MNRHERRAAKAEVRLALPEKHHQIATMHEAGHAVANLLTAREMGFDLDRAISHIDIGINPQDYASRDGMTTLHSVGVTYGPTFTKEIALAAAEYTEAYRASLGETGVLDGAAKGEFMAQVVGLARAAGADIGKWFRARTFRAVAGPMAEAIFSNRSFDLLFWEDYGMESDRAGVVSDGKFAGVTAKEGVATINRMAAVAAYVMQDDRIWTAVRALARKLPISGRMPGALAAKILARAAPSVDWAAAYESAVSGITRLEGEIAANPIVIMTCSGESPLIVKGADQLVVGQHATVLHCECKLPAFAEAIRVAFGQT